MTLAQSLERKGIDVILIEAGGEDWEQASQDLFSGTVVGDSYFDLTEARLRMFGGSSGHWGGVCRPLTRANLSLQPQADVPGWPIDYDALEPYEVAAADILEIPGDFSDQELGHGIYELDFQESPPVHFGYKYGDLVAESPRLRAALNTALMNLEVQNGKITSAHVISDESRRWKIEADYFALCMGGIEIPRLLRWMNDRQGRKLIANHDLIGRYWMEHLHTKPAHGLIFDDVIRERAKNERVFIGTAPSSATDDFAGVNFELEYLNEPETRSLVESVMCVAPRLGNRLAGLRGSNLVCGVTLTAHSEQWPHKDNRVALSEQRDRLGIPKTILNWHRMDHDRDIIVERSQEIADGLALADLGRLMMMAWIKRIEPIPDFTRNGVWHHMGGTRMSNRPQDGIVDANLRVHDQDNLYIGGSSVFSTGGDANPTYTITQLSLRLADHLEQRIRQ